MLYTLYRREHATEIAGCVLRRQPTASMGLVANNEAAGCGPVLYVRASMCFPPRPWYGQFSKVRSGEAGPAPGRF